MIGEDKKPFRIDLQLHGADVQDYNNAEGDIRGMLSEPEAAPSETPMEPAPASETPVEPAPAEPTPMEPAPVQADPMQNPMVQQLMQVVQQQQEAIRQQSEMMKQYMQSNMTNNAPQPSPEVIRTPEDIEAENQEFMERFYSNPLGVLKEHTDKETEPLRQELNAYKEKEAWNNAVGTIASDKQNFPEFENLRARMSDILFKEAPYLREGVGKEEALARAYKIAMSERGPMQQAAPIQQAAPMDMNNPEFIKQIMGNPEVMKMIEQERAKQIQSQNQQVPPMSPSSGVANVAPYIKNQPKEWGQEFETDLRNSLHQRTV